MNKYLPLHTYNLFKIIKLLGLELENYFELTILISFSTKARSSSMGYRHAYYLTAKMHTFSIFAHVLHLAGSCFCSWLQLKLDMAT